MNSSASFSKSDRHAGVTAAALAIWPVFGQLILLLLCLPPLVATGFAQLSPAVRRPAAHDFDGNGKSDLLWRNAQTGEVGIWLIDRATGAQQTFIFPEVDLEWQISGVGDLNGDGKADLVWRNTVSGDIAEWLMDGVTIRGESTIYSGVDPTWQIAGVGDLDGDSKADLVWRNTQTGDVAEWLIDGSTVKAWSPINSGLNLAWQIAGLGDLDGDAKADLIWRNALTGEVAAWLMDGPTVKTRSTIFSALDPAWQFSGAGDLDGDAKTDLVWRNTQSGEVAASLMNGATVRAWATIDSGLNMDWQTASIGDLDGDAKADLVWRNARTGDVVEWLMNGALPKGISAIDPDAAWTNKPFASVVVDHLQVLHFAVTSYQSNGWFNFIPSLRLTETSGTSGVVISTLAFHLDGIGGDGNLPPWNIERRIEAGATREMNRLDTSYGDPELELSGRVYASVVSVTISFIDDAGRRGAVTVKAEVSALRDVGLVWQSQ